jgi:tellurite resistance protein
VLSCLAHAGAEDAEKAREAFDAAARLLHPSARNRVHFLTREASDLAAFPAALERLRKLAPALKRSFVAAAAVSVSHDGQVSPSEAELFRAVAEVLDVPAPVVTEETPVG